MQQNIHIKCIIFGIDPKQETQYVLSTDSSHISLPVIPYENTTNIDKYVTKFLQNNIIFLSDIELFPTIITLNSELIPDRIDNTLYVVYGIIIEYTKNINNEKYFWINFDPMIPNTYSEILFYAINQLH